MEDITSVNSLDGAPHIVVSAAARGSVCVWTGEVVSEETLAIIMSNPVEPADRITLSLGGLSGLTFSHGGEPTSFYDEPTPLSPSGHVRFDPTDYAIRTCLECKNEIASSSPAIAFEQHTPSGHATSSAVYTHPACLTDLCTTLSQVWEHTDNVIGDLL